MSVDIAVVVGWIATASSVIQFWAIADPVREIRALGTSAGKKPYSLYGMIFGTLWWTVYGFYTTQWAVVACDGIGVGFAVWGIEAFLSFPATQSEFIRTRNIVVGIAVVSVVLIGFALTALSYDSAVFMLGSIASIGTVATVSGPLAALREMITNEDVHLLIPRIMAICGVTSFLWTLYSILYNDMYQLPPNLIGFILVLLQMVVYLLYRKREIANASSVAAPSEKVTPAIVVCAPDSDVASPTSATVLTTTAPTAHGCDITLT